MNTTMMKLAEPQKALIYCRVSGKKQTVEGSGLDSQEHRCREYAAANGYKVEVVFPDDVSGGGDFLNRPGMVALLAYLDAQSDKNYTIIFDDLKRFARDTKFHIKLREEFEKRNATVKCLNFNFDDTPEGEFIETVFAAHGALERKQMGRQTVQKMKARVEQGFWVFHAPYGYRFTKSKRGGKDIVRDEPLASVVQEALESFACGRFETQAEVQRFLESRSEFPKDSPNGKIHPFKISRLLNRVFYAGYIEVPNWNISRREGQHEGLISLQTFEKVQQRLKMGGYAPARKDINTDFPLRGFVTCGACEKPLRSGWSKGKCKKYAYYLCQTKGCDSYGKSLRRADVEGKFEVLLKDLCPSQDLFQMAKAMIENAWNQRLAQADELRKGLRRDLVRLDKKINDFLERIVETTNMATINAYERKIAQLENEKLLKAEKLQKSTQQKASRSQMLEHSLQFLSNPWKLWVSGNINLQKTVLRLAFLERLPYYRNEGYRTPKTTLPFKVLAGIEGGDFEMVPPG